MGADFFPRLSGVQHDPIAMRKMVNEQTEIAVLITAPIIIGMISFIDIVVQLFYSKDFGPTATILDWQLMGDFFKVLAWPMGFIILAKGKGKLFIVTELTWNLLFCAGVYFGWNLFGIQITGIAFLSSYILYMGLVFLIARKQINFRWSKNTIRYILIYLPLLLLSFLSVKFLDKPYNYIVGATITFIAAIYSLNHLKDILNVQAILMRLKFKR